MLDKKGHAAVGFGATIAQIAVLNLVFSIDSILTAIGMTSQIPVMAVAIVVTVGIMLIASDPLASFIGKNPTVVMLALAAGVATAFAQTFPDRPVKIVVPFAAGQGADAAARIDRFNAILAEVGGQPAAFVLTVQNINPILKKLDGKLFPFGILRLLWDMKIRPKITSGRLILLGIKAQYRGQGIDSLLFLATHRAAVKQGWTAGEIGWTLEDNFKVNSAIKSMGGYQIATYRVYHKQL